MHSGTVLALYVSNVSKVCFQKKKNRQKNKQQKKQSDILCYSAKILNTNYGWFIFLNKVQIWLLNFH